MARKIVLQLLAASLVAVLASPVKAEPSVADFAGSSGDFTRFDQPLPAPEAGFEDSLGDRWSLAQFRGKVVLLNVWATWCGPCVREMPALDRLQKQLGGDRFQVVAVSIDRDGIKAVAPFYRRHEIKNLKLFTDGTPGLKRELDVTKLPTSFIIAADGTVLGVLLGDAEWDSEPAIAFLNSFIEEAPQSKQ